MTLRALSALLALVAALVPEAALALAGEVTHVSGAVLAQRPDGRTRILSIRSQVDEGDLIATTDNTYVRMKFSDGGDVVLRPNTQLKIDRYSYAEQRPEGDSLLFSLIKGGLRSVTGLLARRNPANYRLVAPNATVGIRGTQYGALFCNGDCAGIRGPGGQPPANGLHVDVSDGTIFVTTRAGSVEFRIGDFGFVANADVLPVLVPASEGVRVELPRQVLSQVIQGGTVGRSQDLECQIR